MGRKVKLRYRIDFLVFEEDGSSREHCIYVTGLRTAQLAAEHLTQPGRLVSYTEEEVPCT